MAVMMSISSIRELVDLWPDQKTLALDVGASADQVAKWVQRQSVPARFHGRILRAAAGRQFSVTADDLVRLHDQVGEADAA